jgi:hypothetical protein
MENAKGNDGFQHAESKTSHCPVLGIDVHGSAGGFGWPFCNSSNRMQIGRAHKRHQSVALRPVEANAAV